MDDCRISYETIAGWRALVLENDLLKAVLLPDKGADLYQLIHKPSGVNVLYQSHWGLQPPGAPPRASSGEREFMWNYEGGWQELFPSANFACTYQGRPMPFHGEVATMPWEQAVLTETAEAVAVVFSVRCHLTPFRLERRLRLVRGRPTLYFDETITNESESPAHFVWGQHCVVGKPFLEAGCRLETPARTLFTPPTLYGETSRLAADQRAAWPMAPLRRRHGGPARRAGPGGQDARRRVSHRSGSRLGGGDQSAAGPDVSDRLGPGGVQMADRLAALWRVPGYAIDRCLRPGHRALDRAAQPGRFAGRG